MRYITCQYFESIRPDSASRAGGCSGGRINTAIDAAQAQVDLYIGRYLPLPEVPPSLQGIMVSLVDYDLSDDEVTELQRERYKNALEMLSRIERGGFPEFAKQAGDGIYVSGANYLLDIDRSGF